MRWAFVLVVISINSANPLSNDSADNQQVQDSAVQSELTVQEAIQLREQEMEMAKGFLSDDPNRAITTYLAYQDHYRHDYEFNLTLGKLLLKMKRKIEALKYFEIAVELNSSETGVVVQTAELYLENNAYVQAGRMFKKVLDKKPKDKSLQQKYMDAVKQTGIRGDMKRAYEFVKRMDPDAHEACYHLAKVHLELQDKAGAYKNINLALKHQPDNKLYQELLPLTIESDQQIEKHFSILQKLAGSKSPQAIDLMLFGRGQFLKGEKTKALKLYQRVWKMDKRLLMDSPDAVTLFYDDGKTAEALELAGLYLAIHPGDIHVKTIQVEASRKLKVKDKDLLQIMSELTQIDPKTKKWWLELARLELDAGARDSAMVHARIWVKRNPDSHEGWKFIASLAAENKNEQHIYARALKKLITMEPEKADSLGLKLGLVLFNLGNLKEAEDLLLAASKSFPKDPAVWYALGKAKAALKRKGGGKEQFRTACALNPENAVYARDYGNLIREKNELVANIKLFELLKGLFPTLTEHKKLAWAYYHNQEYVKSAGEWDSILVKSPEILNSEPLAVSAYFKANRSLNLLPYFKARLTESPDNLPVLDTLCLIYEANKKDQELWNTMKEIVEIDKTYKQYQYRLAEWYILAGDTANGLLQLNQWVSRHPKDKIALASLCEITRDVKDTTALFKALQMAGKIPDIDRKYHYWAAELRLIKEGRPRDLERLVKKDNKYLHGRLLLVRHYYGKGEFEMLVPFDSTIRQEADRDPWYYAPLAEVLVLKKKESQALDAYWRSLQAGNKEKKFFYRALSLYKTHNPKSVPELLEFGYALFPDDNQITIQYVESLGTVPLALNVMKTLLKEQPKFITGIKIMAPLCLALKDTNLAVTWLEKWGKLLPMEKQPWRQLYEIHKTRGDSMSMVEALVDLFNSSPANHAIAYQIGIIYQNLGKLKKATLYYEKAVSLEPENLEYQRSFGLALTIRNDLKKAKDPLLKLHGKGDFDEQVCYALYLIYHEEKNPNLEREMLGILARYFPAKKEYIYPLAYIEDKFNHPREVIRLLEHPELHKELSADMAGLLLRQYFLTNQSKKIMNYGIKVSEIYPRVIPLELALFFYQQKNIARAKTLFDILIKHNPSPEAYYKRALIAFNEKDWNKAGQYFHKGKKFSEESYNLKAQAFENQREFKKAIKAYEDYYKHLKKPATLTKLFELYQKEGKKSDIRDILERLVEAFPQDLTYKISLADAYIEANKRKKALEVFVLIFNQKPGHPKANLYIGIEEAGKDNCASAIKRLQLGLKTYPNHAEAWKSLGDCYTAANKPNSAAKAYKRAETSIINSPKNLW